MLKSFIQILMIVTLALQASGPGLIICLCDDGGVTLETAAGPTCCDASNAPAQGPQVASPRTSDCGSCIDIRLPSGEHQDKVPVPTAKLQCPGTACAGVFGLTQQPVPAQLSLPCLAAVQAGAGQPSGIAILRV